MKHFNHLLLLPIAMLLAIVVSSCSGLTDEEKQFVGEWSDEYYEDSTDEESHLRFITAARDVSNYHEDKTVDNVGSFFIKFEWQFEDVDIRLYYYTKQIIKGTWSADNGIYSDSLSIESSDDNLVAPENVVAVRDKSTGKIERYGLYDKAFSDKFDPEIVKALRQIYKEDISKFTSDNDKSDNDNSDGKGVYKIVSMDDNQIVYEDNDGEKTTMHKGDVMSPQVREMMSEGEALK